MSTSMYEFARKYGERGIAVIPLRGKIPLTKNGSKDATTDPDQIKRWFAVINPPNIGIATGAVSGIVVLDVDSNHGGDDSLVELRERGDLPQTAEARNLLRAEPQVDAGHHSVASC